MRCGDEKRAFEWTTRRAKLIEKSGATYSWNGERTAQGRDKACQYLVTHPELAAELRDRLVALRKAENARLGAQAQVGGGETAAAWQTRVGPRELSSPIGARPRPTQRGKIVARGVVGDGQRRSKREGAGLQVRQ